VRSTTPSSMAAATMPSDQGVRVSPIFLAEMVLTRCCGLILGYTMPNDEVGEL